MTPQFAAALFALGIAGLFVLARDPRQPMSFALWIPIAWLAIGGSRVVSVWLDPTARVSAVDAYLEGNPIDRNVQATLMSLGILVLLSRARQVRAILAANLPIVLFFVYCGASALWSDFPDASLRRWIKAMGDVVMVLVVLSDRDPAAALKLPSRVGFLLIPLSVMLMKYFPDMARGFNDITGEPEYTGVATSKNGLGMVCMIFGLGSVWQFMEARQGNAARRGPMLAHGIVVALAIWLFLWAHSMTAMLCFATGVAFLVLTAHGRIVRSSLAVHALVAAVLLSTCAVVLLGAGGLLLETLGRDATLTGRTAIWNYVLAMVQHPWIGTGYESFWLGDRLERMLDIYRGINQAHNGYIEVYVNLGWIGVALLALVLITGYRNMVGALRSDPEGARFRLVYFVIGVVMNFAEASFKMMSPVWVLLLISVMMVPRRFVMQSVRRADLGPIVPMTRHATRRGFATR
jgi:O-antigen ligase